MASPGDISLVRSNTNESDTVLLDDPSLSALIDELGVVGATVRVWEQKTARLADEVDVTEAGASHSFGDLFDNAQKMLAMWRLRYEEDVLVTTGGGRVKVKVINRQ